MWSVRDGAITGQTTKENPAKENTFLVWTNGTAGRFRIALLVQDRPADNDNGFANSGVQYRSRIVKPSYWVVSGYQADMEAGPNYTGVLYEEKARGILAKRGDKGRNSCPTGKKEVVGSVGEAETGGRGAQGRMERLRHHRQGQSPCSNSSTANK